MNHKQHSPVWYDHLATQQEGYYYPSAVGHKYVPGSVAAAQLLKVLRYRSKNRHEFMQRNTRNTHLATLNGEDAYLDFIQQQ